MPTLIDQAICIRQWDWSETSQTVSLFCRSWGMLRGLAKGARRERGSFSGGISMLSRGEIVAVIKPERELQTLTQWTLLQMFRRPHDDLEANLYALSMTELVQRFLPPSVPQIALFDALLAALERLEEGERPAPEFLSFAFTLLREVGHEPRIHLPDASQEPIPSTWLAFDAEDGGVVDFRLFPRSWRMRPSTLEVLIKVAAREPLEHCDSDVVDRANRLLIAYSRTIVRDDLAACTLATSPHRLPSEPRAELTEVASPQTPQSP